MSTLLAFVFSIGAATDSVGAATDGAGGGRCADTFDRTASCLAVDAARAPIVADPTPPEPALAREPESLPAAMVFFTAGAAVIGASALVGAQLPAAARPTEDEARLREGVRIGGYAFLVGAGAVAASGLALTIFDPASGTMRFSLEPAPEGATTATHAPAGGGAS
jgi:hypothetical protein